MTKFHSLKFPWYLFPCCPLFAYLWPEKDRFWALDSFFDFLVPSSIKSGSKSVTFSKSETEDSQSQSSTFFAPGFSRRQFGRFSASEYLPFFSWPWTIPCTFETSRTFLDLYPFAAFLVIPFAFFIHLRVFGTVLAFL